MAFVVGSLLMVVVIISMFAGLAASFGTKQVTMPSGGAVLSIDLDNGIVDSPENRYGAFDPYTMSFDTSNTMLEVADAMTLAASDPKILGIYIKVSGNARAGYGNIEELRGAIESFKESGKFVVAYNEIYSQASYWLSSVADKVYINPEGMLDWRGAAANVMFYKGLLDKLGAEVQVVRHGTFKAAVEPYISEHMSDANRLQMETLVGSLWDVIVADVSASRGIPAAELQAYASELAVATADDALELGMVDGTVYGDQMEGIISSMAGVDNVGTVALDDYIAMHPIDMRRVSKNRVAVIYADGQIVDGESTYGSVGGTTLAAQIAEARRDDGIKAVVLRVNSPGGSALASEVVWREMELCREVKPVVVSMGSVAASGGYYISAPADVILADRTTQTGSIGVFGMVLNLEKTLRDKLGITVDAVRTSPAADMGNLARPLSAAERNFLQGQVERTYSTFVEHVAQGRNMTFEQVDAIGQGRVWLGVEAERNGLVDGFGGIMDAIALAVDRAGIASDFRIQQILGEPDSFKTIMSMFSSQARMREAAMRDELGTAFTHYSSLRSLFDRTQGVMALMPYTVEFE